MTSHISTVIASEHLGPPGIRGELHIVPEFDGDQRLDIDRLSDKTERKFSVSARLAKGISVTSDIKVSFGPEDGDTYFLFPSDAVACVGSCGGVKFGLKKNASGELSFVQFECEATSASAARRQLLRSLLPFLDHLSYVANCPVTIASLRVEDLKNQVTTFAYLSPYRRVIVSTQAILFEEMKPIYALYREAKNSNSDFYEFLCYHKLLEGLLGSMRADVRRRAAKRRIELEWPKDLVPNSEEIAERFRAYCGKPIKKFFDQVMEPQFRNAIAHFASRDGSILDMSDPVHIDRYAEILFVCEQCVRTTINTHEKMLGLALGPSPC